MVHMHPRFLPSPVAWMPPGPHVLGGDSKHLLAFLKEAVMPCQVHHEPCHVSHPC